MPMVNFLEGDNFYYTLLFSFYAAVMLYLILNAYRNRGKTLVRVHKPLSIETHKVKLREGKAPIIEARGKRAEWAPTYTHGCLYQYPNNILWVIPHKSWALDVKDEAEACIDWSKDNPDPPTLSKNQVKEYSDAQALRTMGRGQKLELPTLFWAVLITSLISAIVSIYIAYRMRIF